MEITSIFFRKVEGKNVAEVHYAQNTERNIFKEQVTGHVVMATSAEYDGKTIAEIKEFIKSKQTEFVK